MIANELIVYKVELLRQSRIFSKTALPGLEPTTFTSTIIIDIIISFKLPLHSTYTSMLI
jgi:hypothetical protein